MVVKKMAKEKTIHKTEPDNEFRAICGDTIEKRTKKWPVVNCPLCLLLMSKNVSICNECKKRACNFCNEFQVFLKENENTHIQVEKRVKATDLWADLSNIPINGNDEIEEPFQHFEAGTYRFDIWHWFEDKFDVSVKEDLIGTEYE